MLRIELEKHVTIEAIRKDLEHLEGAFKVMTQYILFTSSKETISEHIERTAHRFWSQSRRAEPFDIFVNTVHDKVQNELPKIASRTDTINDFRSYLVRTIDHRILDVLKSSKVSRKQSIDSMSSDSKSPIDRLEELANSRQPKQLDHQRTPQSLTLQREREQIIGEILADLEPEYRQLYLLVYDSGLSLKEAAFELGIEQAKIYRFHTEFLLRVQSALKKRGVTDSTVHFLSE